MKRFLKPFVVLIVAIAAGVGFAGCDWWERGDGETWDSTYFRILRNIDSFKVEYTTWNGYDSSTSRYLETKIGGTVRTKDLDSGDIRQRTTRTSTSNGGGTSFSSATSFYQWDKESSINELVFVEDVVFADRPAKIFTSVYNNKVEREYVIDNECDVVLKYLSLRSGYDDLYYSFEVLQFTTNITNFEY